MKEVKKGNFILDNAVLFLTGIVVLSVTFNTDITSLIEILKSTYIILVWFVLIFSAVIRIR